MWIATDGGGINFFDPSEKRFINYRCDSKNPNTLTNDKVLAIEIDDRGDLWAGMWQGGLNYFQIYGDKLILKRRYNYVNESVPNSNSVFNIYRDKNDRLWIGTFAAGAYLFDPRTEKFKPVIFDDMTGKTTSYIIRDILCDSRNDVWFATQLNGLIKIDHNTGHTEIISSDVKDSTGMISKVVIHSLPRIL